MTTLKFGGFWDWTGSISWNLAIRIYIKPICEHQTSLLVLHVPTTLGRWGHRLTVTVTNLWLQGYKSTHNLRKSPWMFQQRRISVEEGRWTNWSQYFGTRVWEYIKLWYKEIRIYIKPICGHWTKASCDVLTMLNRGGHRLLVRVTNLWLQGYKSTHSIRKSPRMLRQIWISVEGSWTNRSPYFGTRVFILL